MTQFANFEFRPEHQGITLAYKNDLYVADMAAPRVPVNLRLYDWTEWDLESAYTVPDTKVGRTSRPNTVEFKAALKTGRTEDYGLDSEVPQDDIANAQNGEDPLGFHVEMTSELVALDREKRVADFYANTAHYNDVVNIGTANQRFDFYDTATSTPIQVIQTAQDTPICKPNYHVMSRPVWTKLRSHPQLVNAVTGQSGVTNGILSREAYADLFELAGIIVGEARGNTARKGNTPVLPRLWGKFLAAVHLNPLVRTTTTQMPTFCYTAEFGQRMAGTMEDPDIGLRGGIRVRVGESVQEQAVSKQCGYLLTNVIS